MTEYKKFENGFEYIEVSNKSTRAKIALQGAHLFHYECVGKKPLLWLSETSFLKAGKIRNPLRLPLPFIAILQSQILTMFMSKVWIQQRILMH